MSEHIDEEVTFVAASADMVGIRARLDELSSGSRPVIIRGPRGCGKQVVARLLHKLSTGGSGEFLRVDCSVAAEEVLTRILFGTEPNSHLHGEPGAFEICRHGTVFLSRAETLSTRTQARIAAVIRENGVVRENGRSKRPVDVRIVASMRAEAEAPEGTPLDGLEAAMIMMPPLAGRREDICALLSFYLHKYSAAHGQSVRPIDDETLLSLVEYSWPGNVRELKEYALRHVLTGRHVLGAGALEPARSAPRAEPQDGKRAAERLALMEVLEQAHWNRRLAASRLQMSYTSLLNKMRRHGLSSPTSGEPLL